MSSRYKSRKRHRSFARRKTLHLESLEPRLHLDASNIFATFQGELTATESSDSLRVYLTPGNFALGTGQVTLGFLVKPTEGSGLRANTADVRSVTRGAVPIVKKSEFADGSSLVLATVKHGEHVLQVTGKNGTKGAWHVQVFLVGDVNCDFVVNSVDYALVSDVVSGKTKDPAFFAEADADRDGKITSFDLARVWDNRGSSTPLRTLAVTAGLSPASDTGVRGDSRVNTVQVNITGQTSNGAQVSLDQDGDGFDDGAATVGTSRSYSLKATLVEGDNALAVRAKDSFGQLVVTQTSVFRDTQLTAPNFNLSIGSDTGIAGDGVSSAGKVSLVGLTDPGETVTLSVGGVTHATTLATDTGTFQFVGVGLQLGGNSFVARVEDAAGNVRQVSRTFTRVAPDPDQKDPVLRWNEVALDAIRRDASSPPVASRTLAMIGVAILDAVNALEGTPSYLIRTTPPVGASAEAAVSSAAHAVLSSLYPAQRDTFDAILAESLAQIPDGPAKSAGEQFGREVGGLVVELRENDGARRFEDYVTAGGAGVWVPTQPMYAEALLPNWAEVEPFALESPDQFRPDDPPLVNSAEYAAALAEVRELGRATDSTRTADETDTALFWADGLGTVTPAGHWNQLALQLAADESYSLSANARLFAQLNIALADTAIAAWDAKYHYGLWRPVTAIRAADSDGNALTSAEAGWTPLLITPNFPSYVSGHSTYSGAAQVILESFFGADTSFTLTSEAPGVDPRSFDSFADAAEEAGRSRILGGIHYAFDNTAGLATGRAIADHVLQSFEIATDQRAPFITWDADSTDPVTSQNIVLQGQVLDNLSGVASLHVEIDEGELTPVSFDASGRFTFVTDFPLDGSADGPHVVSFQAIDHAGNFSSFKSFAWTLDTQAPAISLTAPQSSDALLVDDRLVGTASGTGSPITRLVYGFDDGPQTTVVFDLNTGAFDQPLDLSLLTAGPHVLNITAEDAAGHETTIAIDVTLDAAVPLTVTSVAPAPGAINAGTTEKPKVTFSRPIDPSTLTGDNFFATDTTGAPLDAHIVVANDGRSAWLFPVAPLPGASTISITVDGSTILATDGTLLDAADTGVPGSTLVYRFSTVGLTGLPGTSLTGVIADPGPDLRPGTIDDVGRGPDGVLMTADDVYLLPLANVRVFVLGMEDLAVNTDDEGRFTLPSVPGGVVKLVVDGRTATNAPDGCYFPEMVMDVTIEPGKENTLMGSMGSREQAAASEEVRGVYLPRLKASILQDVSDVAPTLIEVAADAAPDLTDEQRQLLTALVQPGSAIGANGEVLTNVQLGISTVPPELIREMLPPGVSEPPFTITVQAPGVVTFTTPVAISYPNVDNAAPGTKMLFISFNHETGRMEIDGTATVSPDGRSVVTDPDGGLTHPGWHFTITGTTARTPVAASGSNSCGDPSDGDFTYNDDPPISLWASTLVAAYQGLKIAQNPILYAISPETMYEADLLAALALLGGGPGIDAFNHFVGGSGTEVVLGPGTVLGDLAKNSNTVKNFVDDLNKKIKDDLQAQANTGPVVDNRNVALTTGNVSFTFSENEGLYVGFLKSVIGGTQGTNVDMENFSAIITNYSKESGGTATFSYKLHLSICDNFGVDESDITGSWYYNQPFNPLIPFWLLQHRTSGPRPFVNRLEIETDTITGTIQIPPGYEETDVQINSVSTAAGFGTDPSVYYRFVVANGLEITGKFLPDGDPPNVVLPPNRFFQVEFYQPLTNRSAVIASTSGASGATTIFADAPLSTGSASAQIKLGTVGGPDLDGDGIPDIGESVLGTDHRSVDSDGDGISDSAELEQGLDPLNGRSFPTGVIAQLPLAAFPERLTVDGDRVYAATGNFGLAVIDGSRFDGPVIMSQLDLPGTATDVAVDGSLGIAAVATGTALQLVDVSAGDSPQLFRSVSIAANRVIAANGLAYVGSGNQLRVVDLASGNLIQSLTLPGSGTLTGFAREGNYLYAFLSGSDTFSVIDIANEAGAVVTGQRNVSIASVDVGLFVGNGVAWLAGSGLRTLDVTNPANPAIIQTPTGSQFFTARRLVLNGSGLGLLTPDGGNFVQVYDTSDPNNVANLQLQWNLAGSARDVVISRGIAYVATNRGLEVLNYLPFDNTGVAPTVTTTTAAVDQDPDAPGIQVVEGTSIPIQVDVTDNVQVRNVELLVNGVVVRNDVSFPFDFSAVAPQLTADNTTFTVQARATDTGGNVAPSNVLTIELVPDTFAPTITGFVPPTDSTEVEPIQVVQVQFSEPMSAATITLDSIRVLNSQDQVLSPTSFQLRDDDRRVQLTFPPLLTGEYRIFVSGSVTDRAGNELGGDVASPFTLTPRATLDTDALDTDPATTEYDVFEGTTLGFTVSVVPGVDVQQVELVVNGETVGVDMSDPYQFAYVAPNITPELGGLSIYARVTDTAGLATLTTPPLDVTLVEDVTSPALVSFDPADNGTSFEGLQFVSINFSEPIAIDSFAANALQLTFAGEDGQFGTDDDSDIPLFDLEFLNDDTRVRMRSSPMVIGHYQVTLTQDGITDRAGNALGAGIVISRFELLERLLVNGGFEDAFDGWVVDRAMLASTVASYGGDYFYTPREGERFAFLRTGTNNVYTLVTQQFTVRAGDVISGYAFFDTTDYLPFSDNAYVRILSDTGAVVATPFAASIATVGSYGATPWTAWQYMFPAGGVYSIQAGVANGGDSAVDSYFGLDALQVTRPPALMAFGPSGDNRGPTLDATDATTLAQVAADIWADTLNLASPVDVDVTIVDLAPGQLGAAIGQWSGDSAVTVLLDVDADGHGWFVDATPQDHDEFLDGADGRPLAADDGSPAAGRYDALTVILHELGHVLGLGHSADPDDLMAETLRLGQRRWPASHPLGTDFEPDLSMPRNEAKALAAPREGDASLSSTNSEETPETTVDACFVDSERSWWDE